MRILYLTDYLNNVGGAELSARTIVSEVADRPGVDSVVVVGADVSDRERLGYGDAEVVPVTLPEWIDSLPDYAADSVLERLLAREASSYLNGADIVHAHHRRSSLALSHLDTSVPTVSTVRDFWPICPISVYHVAGDQCSGCEHCLDDCVSYQGYDWPSSAAVKPYLLMKRRHIRKRFSPDCAVFIADHLRRTVADAAVLPDRTETIYNPVSITQAPNAGPRAGPPVFVTASSLTIEKGVQTAVDAMERLTGQYPDARLVVFGDGPLRTELEERAAPLGDAVEFHGRVDSATVYSTMRDATATIFPSRWDEPFGRITVESMMLGTPVVGSDVGGIAEVIDHGRTGLLFDPDDADELSDHLMTLVRDEGIWSRLQRDALKSSSRFSPKSIVDDLLELYCEVSQSNTT